MSAQALRIPIRAVFYQEGQEWQAHCLEFDLNGSGSTTPEALASLSTAVSIQIEESLRHNNPANLFTPADGRFFQMFAAGGDSTMASGQLVLRIKSVEIESAELREFSGSLDAPEIVCSQ